MINKERVNYAIKIVDDILEQENVKIGFPTEVNGPKWQQRLFKYMDVETSVIKRSKTGKVYLHKSKGRYILF